MLGLLLSLLLTLLLSIFAFLIYLTKFHRHKLSITHNTIKVRNLQSDRFVVAHLSDFHVDSRNLFYLEPQLTEAIQFIKSIHPDVIVLTGDYVNHSARPIPLLCEHLTKLNGCSKFGMFASMGNHDAFYLSEIVEKLEGCGVKVLRNQSVVVAQANVEIVGLADLWHPEWKNHTTVMQSLTPSRVNIVLSHNPDSAAILESFPFTLQLSGHTHGGQICLPPFIRIPTFNPYAIPVLAILRRIIDVLSPLLSGLRSPVLQKSRKYCFVVKNWMWSQGLHRLTSAVGHPNKWLYVSRGIGSHKNLRVFCPPDLAIIEMVRE